MKRADWDALTDHERREWAIEWGEGRRCIERTGTPWGKHWCAFHDDERLARISATIRGMQQPLEQQETPSHDS